MGARYQQGSIRKVERKHAPAKWVFRYRENGQQKTVELGTIEQLPKRADAQRAAEAWRVRVNHPGTAKPVTFDTMIDYYLKSEAPERVSTKTFYLPWLNNHIRPRWGNQRLDALVALPVQQWLQGLDLSPKSKQHIRSLMRVLYDVALRAGMVAAPMNPLSLVKIKGASKRQREPRVLTPAEIGAVLRKLAEPHSTMVLVAACLGLRRSEIAGLRWEDFDFPNGLVRIQRAWVIGVEGQVKTKGSAKTLPVAPALAERLEAHKARLKEQFVTSPWVFVNPDTLKPWSVNHIQEVYLRPIGKELGICDNLGWHNFRHTLSSTLHANNVDLKVQQELLRHADIRTTMNIYTQAMPEALREAHGQVVKMVIQ